MTHVANAEGEEFAVYRLSKENAAKLQRLVMSVIVEEVDPEDSTQTYVGMNVMGSGPPFRVSQGEYLLHNLDTGQWIKSTPGYFERDYKEI